MPKKRQIPRLFDKPLADGSIMYEWKPSKTLRDVGFTHRVLGTDKRVAIHEALALNQQVDDWKAGGVPADGPIARAPLPRVVRFGELVTTYERSDAFTLLKPASQREYRTRMRQLTVWAKDGQLPVKAIDYDVVRDLRNGLVASVSPWVAATTLRVLRILLAFAEDERIIPRDSNPATRCDIPEPPARRTQMPREVRDAIVEAASALGLDDVAFAIPLARWTLQRQADILGLNRFAWRELNLAGFDIDPRHAAQLVDAKGRAKAFRLAQQKTDTWIDAPVPPMLHAPIEARWSVSEWLFPDIVDHRYGEAIVRDAPMPTWKFQRRFREAQGAAWAVAIMDGNERLADAIDICQFRDLRRTGMVEYGNAGARQSWITALSGHFVLGRKTILDTYMPGDTPGACACVATGIAAEAERAKRIAEA